MYCGGDTTGYCPCQHCVPPKRRERCHGACVEYAEYRADIDAAARKRRQEAEADAVVIEGFKDRRTKYYRKEEKR